MKRVLLLTGVVSSLLGTACGSSESAEATGGVSSGGHGGSATGGSGGQSSTGCSVKVNPTSALCSGAPSCPIVADAVLECDEAGGYVSLAPGPGTKSYVVLTTFQSDLEPFLFTIDPQAESGVERPPYSTGGSFVLSDPSGEPHLIASSIPSVGVAYYSRSAAGWTPENVSSDASAPYQLGDGAFASDASAFVVYGADTGSTYLAKRDPQGAWSRQEIVDAHVPSWGLALDAAGRAYSAYWLFGSTWGGSSNGLFYQEGTSPRQLVTTSTEGIGPGTKPSLIVAGTAESAQAPIVAFSESKSFHLMVPNGSGGYFEANIPSGTAIDPTGCKDCNGPSACTQTMDGTFAFGHALARTADGQIWLAYVHRHLDRDIKLSTQCGEPGCMCTSEVTEDRSFAELVLSRVSLVETTPLDEAWRAKIGNPAGIDVALAARDNELRVVLLTAQMKQTTGRYLVFDTKAL